MKDVRSRRIEELIRIKLSSLLTKGLKDPRLEAFITILGIHLSGDGKIARVVVSVMGSYREKMNVMDGLESARGYIQKRLSKQIKLRNIPHLIFELDEKTEERVRMVHKIGEMERKQERNSSNNAQDR
ncbi:MAG: 30S ribosome-binding factor RbfA [Spirochaetota bacterium]